MNLERIVEKINEDQAAVGVQTTNGNPSVDYLPSNFSTMQNMLNSLAVVKKQWKLNVLDEGDNYRVNFEDAMSVIVPKGAYKEFNEKVVNVVSLKHADLTNILNEARSSTVHKLYNRLNRLLTANLRSSPPIRKTLITGNYWLSLFPDSRYLPMSDSTVIQLNHYDRDVRELTKRIQNIYTDDIGQLEILSDALKEKRPLNAFEPFSEYDYLTGARIQSEENGIVMILELTVNNALVPTQSLYIESQDVLDELKYYKSIKVLKNIVFPVGEVFNVSIFQNLKDIISDMEDAEEQAERDAKK